MMTCHTTLQFHGQISEPIDHYRYFREIRSARVGYQENDPGKPCMVLSGQWLQRAGFTAGCSIQLEVFDDMLVITREKRPAEY